MAIFRSFITSNFGYCSLVWHACSTKNTQKLEKLQLRALRFVYHDYASTYDELLERARRPSLHLGRLRTLATEVYKSVHKLNPPYVQIQTQNNQPPPALSRYPPHHTSKFYHLRSTLLSLPRCKSMELPTTNHKTCSHSKYV